MGGGDAGGEACVTFATYLLGELFQQSCFCLPETSLTRGIFVSNKKWASGKPSSQTPGDGFIDCKLEMTLLPPRGNFADIVYLKEQSFLHRMRDVCTL